MIMQTFRVMTYNLLFGKALLQLTETINKEKPDIFCVQEFELNGETLRLIEKTGYKLADYSHSFFKHFRFYSIATFYNPETVFHNNGEAISLRRSFYEFLLFTFRWGKTSRTALKTQFTIKTAKRSVDIYNLHLTPTFYGTNTVREKQLKKVFEYVWRDKDPAVITGDFNYAIHRRNLDQLFKKYELGEATKDLQFTMYSKVFFKLFTVRFKADYIIYKGLANNKTEKVDVKTSDHYPIWAEFAFRE
jgi:endonuclease/exonuclease/phosphatase family metal-dependent hydrolase